MTHARLVALAILTLLASAAAHADSGKSIPAGKDFGAGITLAQPTGLAEVLSEPERYGTETVLLHGRISEVCQRKGCWTILQDGQASVRVRFVDYGFFLPKDCIGDEAFIQGTVKVETLSEKDARHYEAETRGGNPERIQGPQREVGFLASGVRLVGRQDTPSE
jgi:hypothetical protein